LIVLVNKRVIDSNIDNDLKRLDAKVSRARANIAEAEGNKELLRLELKKLLEHCQFELAAIGMLKKRGSITAFVARREIEQVEKERADILRRQKAAGE
jgi:outer membrane protein TolC